MSSVKRGRKYRVEYFGKDSMLNRCECMDFKTSRLGTCKHIEAISLADSGKVDSNIYPLPEHTSVYVDYVEIMWRAEMHKKTGGSWPRKK